MNHNLLGTVNEAHFLVDDAGRPHLDKVVRGESLGQVLSSAGYDQQTLTENFRHILNAAEEKTKITAAERETLSESMQATLESYTYLED